METELTRYENIYVALIDKLESASGITLQHHKVGAISSSVGNAPNAFNLVRELTGIVVPPKLKACYLRFTEISASWWANEPNSNLAGEFKLINLASALLSAAPKLDWQESTPEERKLHAEFRTIDDQPSTGTGTLVALRVFPDLVEPEVWFHHVGHGSFRLDLDYQGYLDALLLTKGFYYWQYLFADVSFGDRQFQGIGELVSAQLEFFSGQFVDEDFEYLKARARQRR